MYQVKSLVNTEGDAAVDAAIAGFSSKQVVMQERIRLMARFQRLFPHMTLKQLRDMAVNVMVAS